MEAGKSEVANALVRKFSFKDAAFADNLKEMCMEVFGLAPDAVYATKGKAQEFAAPIKVNDDHLTAISEWAEKKNGYTITGQMTEALKAFEGTELRTGREVLQLVGTEICRSTFCVHYHAKALFEMLGELSLKNIAISDARFPDERAMVTENGGFNVLVKCAGQAEPASNHASENSLGEMTDYDFVLYNDKEKGLDYLEKIVVHMYNELLK